MVRLQGSTGPTTKYNCSRCFADSRNILNVDEERTPSEHDKLVTMGQVNPERKPLNHANDETKQVLYEYTKGSAHLGIRYFLSCM